MASNDMIAQWIREEAEKAIDALIAGNIDECTEAIKAIHTYTFDLLNDTQED